MPEIKNTEAEMKNAGVGHTETQHRWEKNQGALGVWGGSVT